MQCVQIEQDKNKVNQSSKTHNSGKDPAEKAKTVKGDRFLRPNPDCFEQDVVPFAHFSS